MMVRSTSVSSSARASLGTSCGATVVGLSSEPRRMRSISAWTRVTGIDVPFTTAAARGGGGTFGFERLHEAEAKTMPASVSAPYVPRFVHRLVSIGLLFTLLLHRYTLKRSGKAAPAGRQPLVPADLRGGRRRRLLRRLGQGRDRRQRLRQRV